MITKTGNSLFKLQAVAILVMMAGWGWVAGNFAAPFDTLWVGAVTAIGHGIPLVLTVVFGMQVLSAYEAAQRGRTRSNWGSFGITSLAILALIATIVLTVIGASNANPDAVGIKSPNDFIAAVILSSGALWWLATLFLHRQRLVEAKPAGNQEGEGRAQGEEVREKAIV